MKTRRAMRIYKCHLCRARINKGDQYARKTFRMGEMGMAVNGKVPDGGWEPYRVAMEICNPCANPETV